MSRFIFVICLFVFTPLLKAQEKLDWEKVTIGIDQVEEFSPEMRREVEDRLSQPFIDRGKRFSFSFGSAKGVVVDRVLFGYPADKVGFLRDMIIFKVGDNIIKTPDDFYKAVAALKPKVPVKIELFGPTIVRGAIRYVKRSVELTPLKQRDAIQGAFVKNVDDVEDLTTFRVDFDQDLPVLVYVVKQGNNYTIAANFRHIGENYIGIQKAIIKTSKANYEFEPTLSQKLNNTSIGREVKEWFSVSLNDQVELRKDLELSDNVTLRLDGRTSYVDHEVGRHFGSQVKLARRLIESFEE